MNNRFVKTFVCAFIAAFFLNLSDVMAQNGGTHATAPANKTATKKKTTTAKAKAKTTKTTPAPAAATAAKKGLPKATFKNKYIDFGRVKTGDMPTVTYEFTNTGDIPLQIDMCSGCECTEMDWTRTSIPPGGKGFVKAIFNTKKAEPADHKKALTKYVDVVFKQTVPPNNYPVVEALKFDVFIID